MKKKYIGLILVLLGILLLLFSYIFITHREQQTFIHSEDHLIPSKRYYTRCFPLIQGDNITISIYTNTSIGIAFVSSEFVQEIIEAKKYTNVTSSKIIEGIEINTTDNYCILLINNNEYHANISYVIKINRMVLVESNPYISITGLILVGIGLFTLYSIPLSKAGKYSDTIAHENIVCKTISVNKHECTVLIEDIDVEELEKIIEYMTKELGYTEKKRLSETIVFLEKKGSLLPTQDYSRKRRTVIVSLEPGMIRMNYIISVSSAAGTIDLEHVYREVESIVKSFNKRTG